MKIIYPENKRGYNTREIQEKKFYTVEYLQSKLVELFGKYADKAEFELGDLIDSWEGFQRKADIR